MYSKTSIIIKIQDLVGSTSQKIEIMWIPSHVGLSGNEKADALAKKGSCERKNCKTQMDRDDIKNLIKRKIKENQIKLIERNNPQNRIYKLKKKSEDWKELKLMNRKDATIITRLRIGHTKLTHKHIFEKTEKPKCSCNEIVTVDHLFECKKNVKLREKLGIKGKEDLAKDDYTHMTRVIKYVKELGLYFEI
jgi:hypothetical protein